ncbi:MAG: methyltransferase, partial [Actinoallomurus sp.]|nr:methyltransferase [Actinoallomurus sp.]
MGAKEWEWDETLFSGSAGHYGIGRMPYPPSLADAVRDELDVDGTGRLLDVGCGPGSLTVLLAPLFASAIGVDADPGMIAEAQHRASEAEAVHIEWRHLRAEDLPADLGAFQVASFAQSFHWMDQPLVARRVRDMLSPDGAWIHVSATTHRGVAAEHPLPHPSPPWERIEDLVARYLGPVRRAGQGQLPHGTRARIFRAADRASMVDRWRRSSRSKSPSTAQNLSASLVSGAKCWGTSYRRHRRGLLLGTISIARCRPSVRVQRSHALIPQVWARDCSSSAFPKARSSRIGCILTCGSAPGSWVKSAWPHLRPN